MSLRWSPILVLVCLLVPSEVRAQNPRLTLKLTGVTCAEALDALSKATGIPVSVGTTRSRIVPAVGDGSLNQKANFSWEGITFANALRAVCDRYNLRPSRQGDSYTLVPATAPPVVKQENRVGLCEVDGHRFYAKSVSWYQSSSRSVQFPNGAPQASGSGSLSLSVEGRLGALDSAALAGVENVTATDDLGNRMQVTASARSLLLFGLGRSSGTFPDEWSQTFSFRSPHPGARKIATLEADVMSFRKTEQKTREVAYPFPGGVARQQLGARVMVVTEEPAAKEREELRQFGIPELLPGDGERSLGFRVRIAVPTGDTAGYPREVPVLYDETGRAYTATSRGTRSAAVGKWRIYETRYDYEGLVATPRRLVWKSTEKSDPVKLFRLRMTDIPLPPAPAGAEAGKAAVLPAGAAALPDHPFAVMGGGTLIFRTERGGKPVKGGTLSVGLAPLVNGRPGTLRWMDVPVDTNGTARLLSVKPGTYRVQRKYRAGNGAAVPAVGWVNAVAVVTVKAGRETVAPPLRGAGGR